MYHFASKSRILRKYDNFQLQKLKFNNICLKALQFCKISVFKGFLMNIPGEYPLASPHFHCNLLIHITSPKRKSETVHIYQEKVE